MLRKDIIKADLEEIYQRAVPWERLENKTVLITGAYGMLASYLVFLLMFLNEEKGMNVRILCVVRSADKFRARFGNEENYEYIKLYTESLDNQLLIEENVDYIIHAASLASPQYYGVCPIEVLKPNVLGSCHLLELAAEKKVEGYLLFSTGDIYGIVENEDRIREESCGRMDPLDIHNCYSESKRMAETMCKAWFHQKGVPAKIVRIWHTYAPTMDVESDPRVFASFVRNILQGQDIEMKSEGTAKRSFCYIADAAAAYFLVLLCGENGEAYNVCNTQEFYSISALAEELVNIYPEKKLKVIKKKREKKDPYIENTVANCIPPDNSKLRALGWEPRYSVQQGFKRVIDSFAK